MAYKDLEKRRATDRAYRARHREEIAKKQKEYYEKHKEEIATRKRSKYAKEKEKEAAEVAELTQRCLTPEEITEQVFGSTSVRMKYERQIERDIRNGRNLRLPKEFYERWANM